MAGSTNEELNDDEIVAVVQSATNEDSDAEEEDRDNGVTHSEAKDAFDIVLKYLEQNPRATPMDVLWAKKWRDFSAKSRLGKLKQKSIKDFFK